MRSWIAACAMLVGTALAFLAPWPVAAALALLAIVALRKGRAAFLAFALVAAGLNVAILSFAVSGPGWTVFGATASAEGALRGAVGAARLTAALGANLATLSIVPPARLLDGLGLPPRASALAGAVLLAAHDVARDFDTLRTARRLEGAPPRRRLGALVEAAALLPLLLVAASERAETRREALRLAGHDTGPRFVPVVAVAALGAAGRLAFLALPNVALTYVVVFLGGAVFGGYAGAVGGAVAMLVTDFALTGLHAPSLVNVPAMALVGALGGLAARIDFRGAAGAAFAASCGVGATFLFSVASDTLTWALLYADVPSAWRPMVLAGLAFNVLPAFLNGALFAVALGPTLRAHRAWRGARRQARSTRRSPELPAAPPAPRPPT